MTCHGQARRLTFPFNSRARPKVPPGRRTKCHAGLRRRQPVTGKAIYINDLASCSRANTQPLPRIRLTISPVSRLSRGAAAILSRASRIIPCRSASYRPQVSKTVVIRAVV